MSALPDFLVPLFVPASRPERFEKAAWAGADAIIIDLEDAVAPNAKEQARAALRSGFAKVPTLLRVNGIGTPWHNADVAALSDHDFAAVVIPKAEASRAFETLCAALPVPVIALVETTKGLAEVRQIAGIKNVARIAFGSLDFCADLGSAHNRETLVAVRCELVIASRLSGLPAPIDGVTMTIDDDAMIASDARHACEMGFGGKLAIHPRQVSAIRTGFAPTPAEAAWAKKVLASVDGAVTIDGAMVDEPVRIRARTILMRTGNDFLVPGITLPPSNETSGNDLGALLRK